MKASRRRIVANIKQVIVVRRDLKMRRGKECAQVAHASMKVFFDRMTLLTDSEGQYYETEILSEEMIKWIEGAFTKIVVSVNSEEEIYELAKKATELDIPHAVIIDNGLTEFHGNKTTTCIAIGPAYSEEIDKLTRDLPLI